jgi:hypothetical protein
LDPRARLDAWKKRKISCPCRVSKHSSPVASRCADWLRCWSSLLIQNTPSKSWILTC